MIDRFTLAEWLRQLATKLEALDKMRRVQDWDMSLVRLAEEAREWAEDLEQE